MGNVGDYVERLGRFCRKVGICGFGFSDHRTWCHWSSGEWAVGSRLTRNLGASCFCQHIEVQIYQMWNQELLA